MMEFLKKLFNKSEDDFSGSESQNVRFILKIDDLELGILEIGILEFKDGLWIFQYSEAFKNQSKYSKVIGFSDLSKVYKSDVLWPFFKIRIPGLKQPMVQEVLKAENINQNDEASLLKRFGRKNISNPYLLEPA
ncbi:MAG: hypothetical protein H6563_02990 [Lewinellaceae bacterium]|nr:hypothetical protein [Lewinellaceae bacterium]